MSALAGAQRRWAPMMKAATVAGTPPTTRQRWRVPFCTTTSPGDSNTSTPSSSSIATLPERDPEIRRVGSVHAGFVAVLHVHPGQAFWCNHVELRRVRRYDKADAAYRWEWTGRRRIVPRVRVGCGLIGTPEEGELSQARDGHSIDLLVSRNDSATLGVVAG